MESRIPDLSLMNRLATSALAAPKAGDKLAYTARQLVDTALKPPALDHLNGRRMMVR